METDVDRGDVNAEVVMGVGVFFYYAHNRGNCICIFHSFHLVLHALWDP